MVRAFLQRLGVLKKREEPVLAFRSSGSSHELVQLPSVSEFVRRRLKEAGIAAPQGRLFLAEKVCREWAVLEGQAWSSQTLVLMPEEAHLPYRHWPRAWNTFTVKGAVAYANLAVNEAEKKIVLMEFQNELNATRYFHFHYDGEFQQWEKWRRSGRSENYRNWQYALVLAAAEYARSKGYSFYMTTPEHHLRVWPHLNKQTAQQLYRNTVSKVAKMLAAKTAKVSTVEEFGDHLQPLAPVTKIEHVRKFVFS